MSGGKFLPGNPGGPGRPKGSIDTRTKKLQETLAKHNFDVGETWLELLADARQGFKDADDENKASYLRIAADITGAIADRVYPRLKAIEHKQTNQTEGLSAEQRLEMLKAATKALEDQVGRERDIGNGSGDSEPEKIQS